MCGAVRVDPKFVHFKAWRRVVGWKGVCVDSALVSKPRVEGVRVSDWVVRLVGFWGECCLMEFPGVLGRGLDPGNFRAADSEWVCSSRDEGGPSSQGNGGTRVVRWEGGDMDKPVVPSV